MNLSDQELQKLIELNRDISKAELRRDEAFLMDVLADDLQFRRASGVVVNREAYRSGLIDPTNSYDYVHADDVEVFSSGDAMIVALRVWAKGIRAKGTAKETPFQGIFRNVRLFRQDPVSKYGWRCHVWFNEYLSG